MKIYKIVNNLKYTYQELLGFSGIKHNTARRRQISIVETVAEYKKLRATMKREEKLQDKLLKEYFQKARKERKLRKKQLVE